MRLLEHQIIEIYHTYQYEDEWTLQSDIQLMVIEMLVICKGEEKRDKRIFEKNEWDIIKKRGYFLDWDKYN